MKRKFGDKDSEIDPSTPLKRFNLKFDNKQMDSEVDSPFFRMNEDSVAEGSN